MLFWEFPGASGWNELEGSFTRLSRRYGISGHKTGFFSNVLCLPYDYMRASLSTKILCYRRTLPSLVVIRSCGMRPSRACRKSGGLTPHQGCPRPWCIL